MMRGAPWPASILIIGDSFSNFGANNDWADFYAARFPSMTVVNEAINGGCLYDTSGGPGPNTIVAGIAGWLAANPDSDIVVWATSATNDVYRRKLDLNAVTLANLTGAATTVLDAIKAANKTAVVVGIPFATVMIVGEGPAGGDATTAQTAYTLRNDFNAWMRTACEVRGFVYSELKWLWEDKGPLVAPPGNGYYPGFASDGLHPTADSHQQVCNDLAAIIGQSAWRKAAA